MGREVPALQEVSLTVEPEEFVAILGPSGCGKSTLLNIIAGLLPATAGAVHFEGAGRPGAPLTATVFQEFALFPRRTVRGNVEFGLEELGLLAADRAERARHYLNLTELHGFDVERQMKWWVDNGFMKRALPLDKIVDTSFLEEAVKQVGP